MKKIVLVFGAHPDDEILGAGGSIQWYKKKEGYKVVVCMVTDGSSTQYAGAPTVWEKKNGEHRQALDLLGVDDVRFLPFQDMKLDTVSHVELNRAMQEVVESVQPEIILTHQGDDLNRDHQEIYQSSLVVTRPLYPFLRSVLAYEVLSSSEWRLDKPFRPNYFFNIESFIEKKKQALQLMPTEVRSYPHPRSPEGIDILARYRGLQSGCRFAEAFYLIKHVVL